MGLNIVDTNVFYSTFTNVFVHFWHVFYVFNVCKNIFERLFYIYGQNRLVWHLLQVTEFRRNETTGWWLKASKYRHGESRDQRDTVCERHLYMSNRRKSCGRCRIVCFPSQPAGGHSSYVGNFAIHVDTEHFICRQSWRQSWRRDSHSPQKPVQSLSLVTTD